MTLQSENSQEQAPRRPLIGVTGGVNEEGALYIRHGYMLSVARAGGIPVLLPLEGGDDMLRDAFERMDGIIISGGADVDPALYGEEKLPECGPLNPARDHLEMLVAKWARESGKPILGICRGCQVMNVAAGGTLVQDIPSTYGISKDVHSQLEDYAVVTHSVDLVPGTLAADVMGCEEVRVNSRHHQCVKTLGEGLVCDGRDRELGFVESFHDPKHNFYLGVQWHPEMLTADRPEALALFEALVRRAQELRDSAAD